MTPRRIQLSRAKGWRTPSNAVRVARPSKWGNPWHVGQTHEIAVRNDEIIRVPTMVDVGLEQDAPGFAFYVKGSSTPGIPLNRFDRPLTIDDVLSRYRAHILETIGAKRIRAELAGKDLGCWCKLDQRCHADILLQIANPPTCEAAR